MLKRFPTRRSIGVFQKQNHQPADAGQELNNLYSSTTPLFGQHKGKTIYLTFDNGYENGYTPQVLDVLKTKRQSGLFVTGHFVKDQPELIKRMAEEGHIIGNHSYHHPDLTTKTSRVIQEELESVDEEVYKITGEKTTST